MNLFKRLFGIPMSHKEIYDKKRQNFIERSQKLFDFLVKDYGYNKPVHVAGRRQEDGTILHDEIKYEKQMDDKTIVLFNSYHPVDYGFELRIFTPSISIQSKDREILFYVLKEDQDMEQSYLIDAVKVLQKKLFNTKF